MFAFHVSLVQNYTFWVVEHFRKETPFGSFECLCFLEFIHSFLTLLMRYDLFSASFGFGIFDSLVDFSIVLFSLHVV